MKNFIEVLNLGGHFCKVSNILIIFQVCSVHWHYATHSHVHLGSASWHLPVTHVHAFPATLVATANRSYGHVQTTHVKVVGSVLRGGTLFSAAATHGGKVSCF